MAGRFLSRGTVFLVFLALTAPVTVAQERAAGDRAQMQALEQTPLVEADQQLFLLDGEIWLRRRGETRFHKGETVTDLAADVAQRRAALRARALTDETPHDLVVDLREAADRAFVAGLAEAMEPTERAGYYRATLTKAETVALADRGIAMAAYPRFPGAGTETPDEEEEAKAPAAKAEGGQATLATEVLFIENVEGDFPGSVWTVGDENPTSGDDFWDDLSCRFHTGSWSAWSADAGDQTDCVTYDNDMLAFMQTTDAIDVSAYDDVLFSYWLWYEVEQSFDFFRWYFSSDGVTWTLVSEFDGSVDDPAEGEWVEQAFFLEGFTDFYMRFEFFSDESVVFEGAYVDDIQVTGNRLFEKNTTISSVLTDVANSSVAWGDYDNDGDLDILLTGDDVSFNRISKVYENDGSGGFTENTAISSVLTGVYSSSVAWGDYDNDGDLDILLTGRDTANNPVSKVYENEGSGVFTENTAISSVLTDVANSSVAWGDYDNDGDLDILLTGNASGGRVSAVYENEGSGVFTENTAISSVLTGVFYGSVACGDYDNDGDLDILLTGEDASFNQLSEVYENDGLGGFTEATAISNVLTGVYSSSVAWGDYDNDGDLDILLTGADASFFGFSAVYENDGSGGFIEATAISNVLTGVRNGSVAWGDYDNDGDLDILLTGEDGSNRVSAVYENDGSGGFTENTAISSVLTGVSSGSVAWGDYDNDGDLDILLTGRDASDPVSEVYENVGGFPVNTPPAAPTNLAATPADTSALLSWDAATDTATPTAGLAYTLRIGTTPGGFDVMAPMSIVNTSTGAGKTAACSPDCPEGYRKIVSLPPVRPAAGGGRVSWQVEGLSPGTTYHWSVQALDGAYAGGAFAAEGSFTTISLFEKNTTISSVLTDVAFSSVAWGDYDNDGDLDILLTGRDASFNRVSAVYENEGSGGFTEATAISSVLTGVIASSVAWGDYDNDGDLDILLTGQDVSSNRVSAVYENEGSGVFTENTTISSVLTDVSSGSVAWGDYDNDGDLDILLTGFSGGRVSEVYENEGSGVFTEATAISSVLTGVITSSVAWGDYDNDGDLDILLTGFDASSNPVSEVYENDGSGVFTENTTISSVLTDVELSSVAWGDYDNDGDLDILLTGRDASFKRVSEVYENEGSGVFTEATAISSVLTDVGESSVAWGDYDNDGDLDILLTGNASGGPVSAVYENEGSGIFTENTTINSVLTDVGESSVAWGDYDNDGDLDILLTGFDASSNPVSEVYENVGGFPVNTPPAAPTNLAAAPTDTSALLSWDAATDTETPTDGLAYTLRIGTTPGGFDVMAPMSIVNVTTGAGKAAPSQRAACSPDCPEGYRKIVSLSPVRPAAGGGRVSWQVEGLTPGTTYHWSVQALDGAFAGGLFANEGSFTTSTGSAIRYVATTGSDTGNDCLVMASPCRTVGHAVSQAQAGDTIQVAAGTYAEPELVIDKAVLFAGAGILIQ